MPTCQHLNSEESKKTFRYICFRKILILKRSIFVNVGSGVSTDIWTSYAAIIMAISVLPFLIVQLPQLLDSSSGRHLAVLIALIFSVVLLISYCLYQVRYAYSNFIYMQFLKKVSSYFCWKTCITNVLQLFLQILPTMLHYSY